MIKMTDDNFNVALMAVYISDRERKHCGKKENVLVKEIPGKQEKVYWPQRYDGNNAEKLH